MIKIKSLNYEVIAEGTLMDKSGRRGRVVTESTNGVLDETFTRAVEEYTVIINKMTLDEYKKMKSIFKFENNFSVQDFRKNIVDGNFFIDSDIFSLSETENKELSTFIYNGSFEVRKV